MTNIFLFSKATDPRSIKVMEDNIPNLYDKKVAYIATAKRGYGYDFKFEYSASEEFIKAKFSNHEIIDVDSQEYAAQNQSQLTTQLHEKLLTFDMLYLTGGLPGYLKYWLDRHKFSEFLPKYLKQGGVYIGSSASSMIMAESFNCVELDLDGEVEFGAGNFKGFGCMKGEIWPHYEDFHEMMLAKFEKENNLKITRLRDGEGIYLDNQATIDNL